MNAAAQPVQKPHAGPLKVSGRFMLPDQSEHICVVVEFQPHSAVFLSRFCPEEGTELVAYLDELGRVECVSSAAKPFGFTVNFTVSDKRLERLQKRIAVLLGDDKDPDLANRRHPRFEPSDAASHFTLADGRVYSCEVVDISVSGANVKSNVMLAIGTFVMLGKTPGSVVRYTDQGVGIAFSHQLFS